VHSRAQKSYTLQFATKLHISPDKTDRARSWWLRLHTTAANIAGWYIT